jgi:hypothetical protein
MVNFSHHKKDRQGRRNQKRRDLLGEVDKRRLKFTSSVSHSYRCPFNTKQREKDENRVVKIIVAHTTPHRGRGGGGGERGEKERRKNKRKDGGQGGQ